MSTPGAEVSQLIERVRAGSDSALGSLLNSYREYLLRVANDRIEPTLRPKMAPSDIVQGSLLTATKQFAAFRGHTEQQFRTWLLAILSTQLIDGLRRFTETEKRNADRELANGHSVLRRAQTSAESPSHQVSLQEDAANLLDAIQSLPKQQRDVVLARYLEDLPFAHIGSRLNLSETTCRRLWLDATESLARRMDRNR